MIDYYYRTTDFGDQILVQLQDEDGESYSLVGKTVTFEVRKGGNGKLLFSRAATVEDADLGNVSYVWQEDDFPEAGLYEAIFVVRQGLTQVGTFPRPGAIRIQVT